MLVLDRLTKCFAVPRKASRGIPDAPKSRGQTGSLCALSEVSFSAPRGAILGVLGRNGAGKTTMLRLLSTALRPSSGTARFEDVDIVREPAAFRQRLGFLSGSTGVYGRLTPRELLHYHGRLHRVGEGHLQARVDELARELDFASYIDRRCDTLSTGMKQKVSIARTLVHDPDVVILDEPTSGLDVVATQAILELVANCRIRHKTVLLSTHHMAEVERLCDQVVVLEAGRLCFSGTPEGLRVRGQSTDLARALLHLISEMDRC